MPNSLFCLIIFDVFRLIIKIIQVEVGSLSISRYISLCNPKEEMDFERLRTFLDVIDQKHKEV